MASGYCCNTITNTSAYTLRPDLFNLGNIHILGRAKSRLDLSKILLLRLVEHCSLGRSRDFVSNTLAIEQGRNLFEWKLMAVSTLGLDEEEVQVNKFETDPNGVDDVVPPRDGLERNRVDVSAKSARGSIHYAEDPVGGNSLVKDERGRDADLHNHESLGPDSEWQTDR